MRTRGQIGKCCCPVCTTCCNGTTVPSEFDVTLSIAARSTCSACTSISGTYTLPYRGTFGLACNYEFCNVSSSYISPCSNNVGTFTEYDCGGPGTGYPKIGGIDVFLNVACLGGAFRVYLRVRLYQVPNSFGISGWDQFEGYLFPAESACLDICEALTLSSTTFTGVPGTSSLTYCTSSTADICAVA